MAMPITNIVIKSRHDPENWLPFAMKKLDVDEKQMILRKTMQKFKKDEEIRICKAIELRNESSKKKAIF